MTIIKMMKKGPLTAAQKEKIAKISDFVIHPKGSAIIKPKEFGLHKLKVDAAGSLKPSVRQNQRRGRQLKNIPRLPPGVKISKGGPRWGGVKRDYKPTAAEWKRIGRMGAGIRTRR